MRLRLAWIADPEDAGSYSARETRVLLRAMARRAEIVPIWIAVGSLAPPHFWNGIRVFPLPRECVANAHFLQTLLEQQRPHVVLSNIPRTDFPAGFEYLANNGRRWIHRVNPQEGTGSPAARVGDAVRGLEDASQPALSLFAAESGSSPPEATCVVPYLEGLDPDVRSGVEPSTALERLWTAIMSAVDAKHLAKTHYRTHLVMRQQLFCNASLAHVMFELTNALLELGVPTVAQDEHSTLSKGFVHREVELCRAGAPAKYERIFTSLHQDYDPENSVTAHFAMLKPGARYTRFGLFPALAGREVLYTTGNHSVEPSHVRELAEAFEMILAPSWHVLQPYLAAGLSRNRGAVIPHGIDPSVFSPESPALRYETRKRFRFLQTSFPWICEKGFDLTIKAFCRAFSATDDVALVLRTPHVRDEQERKQTFVRLDALVKEEMAKPRAPEILLVEQDVRLNERGGVYTGAHCYVHPLRAEGFGMTILEAMACGLPVIATAWSGPADFLSPRYAYTLRHSNPVPETTRNGRILRYHVEPDLEHLICLMRYIFEHQDEAGSLGVRAAGAVRRDWTWKSAAAKLSSVTGVGFANPETTLLATREFGMLAGARRDASK